MITTGTKMNKGVLLRRGQERCDAFCDTNNIPRMSVLYVKKVDWKVNPCAYWRKGVAWICLELCADPCKEPLSRNWSWPGSKIDRTPYGVLCHELGHHCDVHVSENKGSYYGDYSIGMKMISGEEPISGYNDNPAEYFAEMFRVFVTNHALLRVLRPRTHRLLREKFKPVSGDDWLKELGDDVPARVVKALRNKMKKS